MKGTGMVVVSFRGVNCRFWSHVGCSGQKANSFTHAVSLRAVREEISIYKKTQTLSYCVCMVSLSLVGKIKPELRPDWSPLGMNFNFPTNIPVPFIWESPPRGHVFNKHFTDVFVTRQQVLDNKFSSPLSLRSFWSAP